jgi:hypothetical protein
MSILHAPIAVGTASANAAHKADLGKVVFANGKIYIVAKLVTTLADAGGRGVVTEFVAGAPTWNVDLPANPQGFAFGVIPKGQKGSTNTTALQAGDYFLLQVSGPCTVLSGTTAILDTTAVQAGLAVNSLGLILAYAQITSITVSLAQQLRNTSYLTQSAAVAVSGDGTAVLSGLI